MPRAHLLVGAFAALALPTPAWADSPAQSAQKALAVLQEHCHRCHGKDGAVEGGFNFVLDRDKLLARGKVVPGDPDRSPLFRRMASGKMPPPSVKPRPTPAELELVRQWIRSGAGPAQPRDERPLVTEPRLHEWILADLEKHDGRSRRFLRYISLAPQYNMGASKDELATYRKAMNRLINSLSWHPRITLPQPIDPDELVLRIDLRDFQWDANLWNRLVAEYPYGVLPDTGVARAVLVSTGTRMPVVRLDWFLATASRAPLYYDLLALPTNLSELERQLRVDVPLNIQQERVARLGFLGSGVSQNNRIIERHDSMNGAYWRSYDFDAIPQNLVDRDLLLPDRRNIFAYPLGPGLSDNTFLHAGGEVIFDLPNGLHGYVLVDANNVRINKGPTAIVSDPKRPDRAVEAGVSCMGCHVSGILPKDDQVRDHVRKNWDLFGKDAGLITALYPPREKTRALMEEDAQRFQNALAQTGNSVSAYEPIMTMTLRYEADVDLPTLAAEVGLRPEDLLPHLTGDTNLARNLGALRTPGATVARQVVVQSHADVARAFRQGSVYEPGSLGQILPDNTGELDPLEVQSSPANAVAFSPDGKLAAVASADRTVILHDVTANRPLRRLIGHTASVWAVAFSPDGRRLLSGSKDATVKLWDVATGRELRTFSAHRDLVTAVAFSPNGRQAVSAGFDHRAILWDLDTGKWKALDVEARYPSAVAFSPDGTRVALAAGRDVWLLDVKTGDAVRPFQGHTGWVTSLAYREGRLLSGSDDGTARLWDVQSGKESGLLAGHAGSVKSVSFDPSGKLAVTGGSDASLRIWDASTGKEVRRWDRHAEAVVAATFLDGAAYTLSASRDGEVKVWRVPGTPYAETPAQPQQPASSGTDQPPTLQPSRTLRVGGTLTGLQVSPDGRFCYCLDLAAGKILRIDVQTGKLTHDAVATQGTEVLGLSPSGRRLATLAPGVDGKKSRMQIFDATLKLLKSHDLPFVGYDLVMSDQHVYVSGGSGDWTDVAVIDPDSGKVLANWGGVWRRSLLRLSPDQKRLYVSSQDASPGTLHVFTVPGSLSDRPEVARVPSPGRQPLGGPFVVSPDGRHVLFTSGTVLRDDGDGNLRFHHALEPFVSVAFLPDRQLALVLSREGTLDAYRYPDYAPVSSHPLGVVGSGMASSAGGSKLILTGIDPTTLADRPRSRGTADVFVVELDSVTSQGR